jgi:Uma2 family endonuclease
MTAIATPPLHRWTYEEWDQMVESGVFDGQNVEFIDGEVLDMAPQKDVHAAAVSLAFKAVWHAAGKKVWVRSQLPLRVGETSEPEPDVSVVPGSERDYVGTGHPIRAAGDRSGRFVVGL